MDLYFKGGTDTSIEILGGKNMVCPNCGCECDENSMFCTKCGTKINAFENDIAPTPIEKTNEDTFTGITIESGKEETDEVDREELKEDVKETENTFDEDIDDFEDAYIPSSKHKYKSVDQSYKDNATSYNKKKLTKKNFFIIAGITIALIVVAIISTLFIKKSVMTEKFDRYYSSGEKYFQEKNYEYAKSQFILASENAFTKEQKIKAYEKVYEVDGMLGNYEQEQIHYLELLIDVDEENVDYYKELIVLYQNNDMNSEINTLIANAPKSIQSELKAFGGTIPAASVKEGTYDKPIEVKLSASDDVKIYYTLDGTNPIDSVSKKEYKEPINLATEGTYTLRAYSEDKNKKNSKDSTFKYVLQFKKVDAPSVEPKSGEYESEEKIVVTAPAGCKIYYTKDGSVPTAKDKLYTKPIEMPKENCLFYFVAINEEGISSQVVTRAYNYAPNKISYDQAVNKLTDYLVSSGEFENDFGEFENGDVSSFEYKETAEIDSTEYYIIQCQIEDKDGISVSGKTYAISCESGNVHGVSKNGNSYELN